MPNLSEDNVAVKRNQSLLEGEVAFLNDEVKALWEKLNVHPPVKAIMTDTSSQPSPRVEDDSIICATNKEYENPTSTPACAQWKEDELLVVNLPTSNSFSPLQEPPQNLLKMANKTSQRQLIPNTLLRPLLATTTLVLMK